MKKWTSSLLVAGFIVGLALIARWDTEQSAHERHRRRLLPFAAEAVEHLEIYPADAPPLVLSFDRSSRLWQFMAPQAVAADQRKITALLTTLCQYQYERLITSDPQSWPEYGLSPAVHKLIFSGNGMAPLTLYVGIEAPIAYGLYTATSASDAVYFGSHYLALAVRQTFADLREP